MGGFFGVASKENCIFDLFFGTDYHSHLGTRRAGMAVYDKENGFDRAIHNIENAPFRTKFDKDANTMQGHLGIVSTRIREAFTVISAIRMEHPSWMTTSKLIRALLHVVMTTSLNKQRALSVQRLRMAELVIGLRGSPRCLRIS